jgi:hypothetical protein
VSDDDRQFVGVLAIWERGDALDTAAGWLQQAWSGEFGAYALHLLRFEGRRFGDEVTIGPIKLRVGGRTRSVRHRKPWQVWATLLEAHPQASTARLQWLIWHSGIYGISVEACYLAGAHPHVAVEIGAAYAVDTPGASVDELRDRATRSAQLAFDGHGAGLARAYGCSHFAVRPSLTIADYLDAVADLPSLVTLVR